MAESIPKAKSAYAFFQAAMNKQMVGVPLGESPASMSIPSRRLIQNFTADAGGPRARRRRNP